MIRSLQWRQKTLTHPLPLPDQGVSAGPRPRVATIDGIAQAQSQSRPSQRSLPSELPAHWYRSGRPAGRGRTEHRRHPDRHSRGRREAPDGGLSLPRSPGDSRLRDAESRNAFRPEGRRARRTPVWPPPVDTWSMPPSTELRHRGHRVTPADHAEGGRAGDPLATARLPAAKRTSSNMPIGPVHKTVPAGWTKNRANVAEDSTPGTRRRLPAQSGRAAPKNRPPGPTAARSNRRALSGRRSDTDEPLWRGLPDRSPGRRR